MSSNFSQIRMLFRTSLTVLDSRSTTDNAKLQPTTWKRSWRTCMDRSGITESRDVDSHVSRKQSHVIKLLCCSYTPLLRP